MNFENQKKKKKEEGGLETHSKANDSDRKERVMCTHRYRMNGAEPTNQTNGQECP